MHIPITMVPFLFFVLCVQSCLSQTVSDVYSFPNSTSGSPYWAPTQGRDGNLYGPAEGNSGFIFKLTPAGTFTTIFTFDYANNPADGFSPSALTLASDGNFYGTTRNGGASSDFGVLFKITPTGTLTVLHTFAGGSDGEYPLAPPIEASDGNLYGTTEGSEKTGGTIYRYTLSGSYSSIYQFTGTYGMHVDAPLIEDINGNLDGMAFDGGRYNCGTVFQMSTAGAVLTYYSFVCHKTGANPTAALVQASDGTLYGTTVEGGNSNNDGVVFSLTPSFEATALYLFQDGSTDGLFPQNLVLATDGNLYGTTAAGPATSNAGTLYQVSTSGTYQLLYAFNSSIGMFPSWLMQHTNGLLYGAAEISNAGGAIYKLDMGLGPFITFVRANGKAGQTAQILGEGLIGTTSITFNGTPATSFKVASNTYMTAVVPSGATSGPVVVTTPKGTLTSNKNFTILP